MREPDKHPATAECRFKKARSERGISVFPAVGLGRAPGTSGVMPRKHPDNRFVCVGTPRWDDAVRSGAGVTGLMEVAAGCRPDASRSASMRRTEATGFLGLETPGSSSASLRLCGGVHRRLVQARFQEAHPMPFRWDRGGPPHGLKRNGRRTLAPGELATPTNREVRRPVRRTRQGYSERAGALWPGTRRRDSLPEGGGIPPSPPVRGS